MAHFSNFDDAKYNAESLHRQEVNAAIIKFHEACGGSGLTDPGRGDTTDDGRHYKAKERALVDANTRRDDKISAAHRHFGMAPSRFGSAGDPFAAHAKYWLETGEADPPARATGADTARGAIFRFAPKSNPLVP